MDLTKLVSAGIVGGWVRAGVGALLTVIVAHIPWLSDILTSETRNTIAVVVSTIVVGVWSHYVKSEPNTPGAS